MEAIYADADWDAYAQAHLAVMSSGQFDIYQETAALLSGKVADFGCGTAKIAPFLADTPAISGYLGVDASAVMVAKAQQQLAVLQKPSFAVCCARIEALRG